jgi:hypothetical protein
MHKITTKIMAVKVPKFLMFYIFVLQFEHYSFQRNRVNVNIKEQQRILTHLDMSMRNTDCSYIVIHATPICFTCL